MKYLLLALFSFSAIAQIDVVFDLDWTLFYPVQDRFAGRPNVYEAGGKFYRLADGAREVIAEIYHSPEMRVSFFSGGVKRRNHALLKQVFLPNSNISFYEAAHKILNFDDMTVVSKVAKHKFWEKRKKDISRVAADLKKAVLLDDIEGFMPWGQRKNLLHLGATYSFQEKYFADNGKYSPPTELDWLYERKKIYWGFATINDALENSKKSGRSFIKELRRLVRDRKPKKPSLANLKRAELEVERLAAKYGKAKHYPKSMLGCMSFFAK